MTTTKRPERNVTAGDLGLEVGHTSGPWELVTYRFTAQNGNIVVDQYIIGGATYIAAIESETDHSRHGYLPPKSAAPANARLIAAAPELLEACKALLSAIAVTPGAKHVTELMEAVTDGYKACAKAEGRDL